MSHNCFVPGCTSGYGRTKARNKEKGLKNPSLFRPPRDMIKKWQNAIKRADKKLEPTNVVCEIHFLESDIERYYVSQLPDGSVFSLKRGIPKLKDGVVPSVFPAYPKHLNIPIKKRKPLMERSLPSQKKKKLGKQETVTQPDQNQQQHEIENLQSAPSTHDSEMISTSSLLTTRLKQEDLDSIKMPPEYWSDQNQQQHEIENLQSAPSTHDSEMISTSSLLTTRLKQEDLDSIKMPSEYWFACLVAGNMGFTCWKDDLSLILKRVVIDPSLNITVFFCERSVNIDGIRSVGDISSISKVLAEIHNLNVCLDALGEERSKQCIGYVTKDNRKGPQKKRCLSCKKNRDSLCRKKRKERIHIQKQKKSKMNFRNCYRRNKRLKSKMVKLTDNITSLKKACAEGKVSTVNEALSFLAQRSAAEACLAASK